MFLCGHFSYKGKVRERSPYRYRIWVSTPQDMGINSTPNVSQNSLNSAIAIAELVKDIDNEYNAIRQLQLTNLDNFPLSEFLSISFSHHIAIINNAKDVDERLFYIRYCHNYKPTTEGLPAIIKK